MCLFATKYNVVASRDTQGQLVTTRLCNNEMNTVLVNFGRIDPTPITQEDHHQLSLHYVFVRFKTAQLLEHVAHVAHELF